MAAAFFLRVGVAVSSDWIYRSDELVQHLEQAHRLVFAMVLCLGITIMERATGWRSCGRHNAETAPDYGIGTSRLLCSGGKNTQCYIVHGGSRRPLFLFTATSIRNSRSCGVCFLLLLVGVFDFLHRTPCLPNTVAYSSPPDWGAWQRRRFVSFVSLWFLAGLGGYVAPTIRAGCRIVRINISIVATP